MIRALSISTLTSGAFYLFQGTDAIAVLREFGFPILVAVVMFIYFTKQINSGKGELTIYRDALLSEQGKQTQFLKELLKEAKASNVCHFIESAVREEREKKI